MVFSVGGNGRNILRRYKLGRVNTLGKDNDDPIKKKDEEHLRRNELASRAAKIKEVYDALAVKHAELGFEGEVIESAKEKIWVPDGLEDVNIDHILSCCGFHKDKVGAFGERGYDPRLVQAINMAINVAKTVKPKEVSNGTR